MPDPDYPAYGGNMPKLDIERISALTEEEETTFRDELDNAEIYVSHVLQKLRIKDIREPEQRPGGIDINNLDKIPNSELGALYMTYNGWTQYIRVCAAKETAGYKVAKGVLKRVELRIRKNLASQGVPKDEIARMCREVPFYEEIATEVDTRAAKSELLDAFRAAYSNNTDALSRIITLRGQELDQDRRGHSVNSMRPNMRDLRTRAGAKVRE